MEHCLPLDPVEAGSAPGETAQAGDPRWCEGTWLFDFQDRRRTTYGAVML